MGRTARPICLFARSGIGRYCPIFRERGAWTDLGGNGFFKAYQSDHWGLVNELQWTVLQKKTAIFSQMAQNLSWLCMTI